ncbi:putative metal-binding motif-containing protein [Candidatus Woesearchaeota archaeon]|nr:putative metal-binding motif-containing protein [Candidatus Woesearchaeota archaeon]
MFKRGVLLLVVVLSLSVLSTLVVALCSPTERSCGCGGKQTRFTDAVTGGCTAWEPCSVADSESACADAADDDCDGKIDCADSDCGQFPACTDDDGDGVKADADCDDTNAAVFPGNPEVCDNLDNNCNGVIDEFLTKQCGTSNIGVCIYGTQKCGAGVWSSCTGAVNPSNELCNSVDDDCDGRIDEGCQCTTGDTRLCGLNIGACKPGTQSCVSGVWGICSGGVTPLSEQCGNGIDDDCDNSVDEDCSGAPATNAAAAVAAPAVVMPSLRQKTPQDSQISRSDDKVSPSLGCVDGDGDGFGLNCVNGPDCDDEDSAVNPAAKESCNAKDDNCNQLVDENLFQPCGINRGICTAGLQTCSGGAWPVCSGVKPKEEVCKNSLDDDCDGSVDEECTIAQRLFLDEDEKLKRVLDADLGTNYNFEEYQEYLQNSKNFINVKKSSAVVKGKTVVKLEIVPIQDLFDVTIYEEIPKAVADSTDKLTFRTPPRIIQKDPLIAWHFVEVKERIDLSYEIEGEHAAAHIESKTTAFAKGMEPRKESLFVLLLPLVVIPALGFAVVLVAGLHKKK